MKTLRFVLFPVFVAGGLALAGEAAGQHLSPATLADARWAATGATSIPGDAAVTSPSFERVLLGSALGTVAGAAVGLGIAALVYSAGNRPDEDMFPLLGEAVLIGLPLTALGAWAGTRIASGGAGNPWLTGVGALAGVGLGVGLGVLAGDATGSEAIGVAVAVPITIVLPAVAEFLTAR